MSDSQRMSSPCFHVNLLETETHSAALGQASSKNFGCGSVTHTIDSTRAPRSR